MNTALEIHLGFAFFVFLVALFTGWVQLGRWATIAVIIIQLAIGVAVAVIAGTARLALPGTLWVHIAGGVLALAAYVAAYRIFERSGNKAVAIALSFVGFALVIVAIWFGSHATLTHGL
jgi:hypothetical protein